MNWKEGEIDGVVLRPPVKHEDHRGWLAEVFRSDSLPRQILPVMSYVSVTRPGATRGPHQHVKQTDIFAFMGPGNFRVKLWDNRIASPTYGNCLTVVVGEDNPMIAIVPPGIVHGYTNVSATDAWISNYPDHLFAGKNGKEPVDEIRYEDTPDSDFSMS